MSLVEGKATIDLWKYEFYRRLENDWEKEIESHAKHYREAMTKYDELLEENKLLKLEIEELKKL